ncbi:MAG: RNA methyltransferase [Treponema sp.]|nr:RNA methyltransferase [Treponema sp.]
MQLHDIKIILSNVSDGGNAGAVCRVMKNMELGGLRLASPQPLILERILTVAVNALDVWENARIFKSLGEAVSDCSIVVGTTRRRGSNRKNISMTPRDLAAWLAERPGPAAIVFGNERTGLEENELNLCNFASHIPVSEAHPSLNLSHAVQIYAYEFFLAMGNALPVKGEWTPMNQTEIAALTESITDTLAGFGFYKKPNREEQTRFLRDIISRAGLSTKEGLYFKEIVAKSARLGG